MSLRAFSDPTAAFSYNFPLSCEKHEIQFVNNSSTLSGTLVFTIWDFGDGNSSAAFAPSHSYNEAGNYTVTLTVQNSDGDFDVTSQVINVDPLPQVDFEIAGTVADQCESTLQSFNNLSSIPSNDLTYEWDFGDGEGSTGENPDHLFDGPGSYTVTLTATSTSSSCVFSVSKQVIIYPEAEVSFSVDNECYGNAIEFTNETTVASGTMTYLWDFGDGSTSLVQHPTHKYATAGDYAVILQVTSEYGCITSHTDNVTVFEQPGASFTSASVCLGVETSFTNTSTFSDSYLWDFGDGNTSTDANPTHEYASFGSYSVSLVAMNAEGCKDSIQRTVQVYPLPITEYTMEDVCFGTPVIFTNTSQINSGTVSYQWDFGDGSVSSAINPKHSYQAPGDYTVTLTSTSDKGCVTTLQDQVSVYIQPVTSFSVNDVCLDSVAIFTNETTGSSLSYSWDFGDGTDTNEKSPVHQYVASGTYLVSLLAVSEDGCSDQHSKKLTIKPLPEVNFVFDEVCDTVAVPFTNLSAISSGSLSYDWSFGDGISSMDKEPTHLYPTHGDYQVTLTATSDGGCVSSLDKTLTVFARPQAAFEVEAVCDGQMSLFSNTSTIADGVIARYSWNFGDGTNSIVKDPEKLYLNKGVYTTSLTVYSDEGCESEYSQEVVVNEFPIADFSVENVCFGFPITPQNSSFISTGDLQFVWDFGDGSTSTAVNPTHVYKEPGVYTITLSSTSGTDCSDVIKKDVRIYAPPVVGVSKDTTVSQGFPVRLFATGGVSYNWTPVQGLDNSSIDTPSATPMQSTTYSVLVTDQYGCENTDSVTVHIEEDFKLIVNNVFTPDDNGQNDTWVVRNVETFGTVNVRVYDRFGTLVFQDKAYNNDWEGTYGKDILPDGTYYYLITFSDSPKQYQGALTIMRNR